MDYMPTEQFLKRLRIDRRYHVLSAYLEALIQAFDTEEFDEPTKADTRYSPPLAERYKTIRLILEALLVILRDGAEDASHFDRIEDIQDTLSMALAPYELTVRKQRLKPEAA